MISLCKVQCLRGVAAFSIRKPELLDGYALPVSISLIIKLNNGAFCEMLWHFIISGHEDTNILEL